MLKLILNVAGSLFGVYVFISMIRLYEYSSTSVSPFFAWFMIIFSGACVLGHWYHLYVNYKKR